MNKLAQRLRHTGLHRPRLLAALVLGVAVFAALPAHWTLVSRALVAWNGALWPYLASMAWLMLRSSPEKVQAIARQEDASSGVVLAVVSGAAVLSLVAIVAQLAHARSADVGPALAYALPLVTVVGSWLLLGAVYTFHYAHMFYQSPAKARALRFPEELAAPTYHDFLYFSFTIAAAVQTSDVTVMSTRMRGVVVTQSVLCFFFNTAVLGLLINIAAGLVGRA
ncbi:MAG: DUF1345 domain-containing protein [Burkholderiales bacterium]|nr:DUF1345 domain-containing protein [Burkholderiales bacterium]